MKDSNLVQWTDRYRTGIPLIDDQHKKLIDVTNKLYVKCLAGNEAARTSFLQTIHKVVDYVRFHFTSEEKIMERISYPGLAVHKREHQEFVKEILQQIQSFQEGEKFVPNAFVRYLGDWVLTHIAVSDKGYALYLAEMKKRGVLPELLMKASSAPIPPKSPLLGGTR
ncbi:MAG: bacteriohemerythrin [Treponema sp.]|jgi:hemerythrin|nr:bacteriohemerythrin [Treponema sp.]